MTPGTINNAVIGGTTPAAATVTTLSVLPEGASGATRQFLVSSSLNPTFAVTSVWGTSGNEWVIPSGGDSGQLYQYARIDTGSTSRTNWGIYQDRVALEGTNGAVAGASLVAGLSGTWEPGSEPIGGALPLDCFAWSTRGGSLTGQTIRVQYDGVTGGVGQGLEIDLDFNVSTALKYGLQIVDRGAGAMSGTQIITDHAADGTFERAYAIDIRRFGGHGFSAAIITANRDGATTEFPLTAAGKLWIAAGACDTGLDWPWMTFSSNYWGLMPNNTFLGQKNAAGTLNLQVIGLNASNLVSIGSGAILANISTQAVTFPGVITSTVATGTAPLSIASTTQVGNLNASFLRGNTFEIPGTVGSTTPNTGAFTTLTATSINKVAITAAASSATLTIADGKTFTVNQSITLIGSDGATYTFQGTDTIVGRATTDTLTNKTYDTAGTGNSFSINGVAATANTGTGAVVRGSSPSLTTPTLGVATATSINGVSLDNNAWTTYMPSISPASGSFTSASATGRYKQIGKKVSFQIKLTVTTVGTATLNVTLGLPSLGNAAADFGGQGIDTSVQTLASQVMWTILSGGSTLSMSATSLASGKAYVMNGEYEVA